MRVNWLCQCGNGRLAVEEDEVPYSCPTCGHPIRDDCCDRTLTFDDLKDSFDAILSDD